MATERFPKAKYLRQLAAMQRELLEWKLGYYHELENDVGLEREGRLTGRLYALDHVIDQITALRDSMYGLPRLS